MLSGMENKQNFVIFNKNILFFCGNVYIAKTKYVILSLILYKKI